MVCDIHNHLQIGLPLMQATAYIKQIADENDVEKLCLLSVPTSGPITYMQNLRVLAAKDRLDGRAFAFMGFDHTPGHKPYLTQLEEGLAMGFEGLKILETKPDIQKQLRFQMSDDVFDAAYDRCEALDLPVLMHVADPATSWDRTKIDKWALEHGRCYDDPSFMTRDELYGVVEAILQKHPRLRLILAHFYFMSDELDRADAFLTRYPRVCFDLTPGKEMYLNFPADREKAVAFFQKYADRFYYGTDVHDEEQPRYHGDLHHLIRDTLGQSEPFDLWGNHYHPLGLEPAVTDRLFRENFYALLGDTPKRVDKQAVARELAFMESRRAAMSERDREELDVVKRYFQ